MTLLIPSGFGQAVAHFTFTTGFSNPMNIVFGYENVNDVSATTAAQAIGNEISAAFNGTAMFTNQVVFDQLSVLQQPGDASGVALFTTVGASSFASLPPNTCLLVHKRTASGGRQNRGRMYWPSVSVAGATENGALDPTLQVGAQGVMTDLLLGMASDFLPMVILHTAAVTPTPVILLAVDPVLATQRRRMRD